VSHFDHLAYCWLFFYFSSGSEGLVNNNFSLCWKGVSKVLAYPLLGGRRLTVGHGPTRRQSRMALFGQRAAEGNQTYNPILNNKA
jgi:hypothetical protein